MVKNSIGNEEAKEFICMTHGHELRRGMLEGAIQGRKNLDNCNSIINKIYLKFEMLMKC